jgi:putative N-acetylmannosamine-6-phosphate epimerase
MMQQARADARIELLRGRLIVSCQPVTNGPLDRTDFVVAQAQAVTAEGAAAVRIEGVERVAAVHRSVAVPIIGIVKIDLPATDIRITPRLSDIDALADAGAAIVAFDATDRSRPAAIPAMIARVHERGALAMADVATIAEGHAAAAAGADLVASTLSGYVGPGPPPREPDIDLVRALAAAGLIVVAEGNVRLPAQAAALLRAGAHAVVVGSAITRPEHVTRWFLDAIAAP